MKEEVALMISLQELDSEIASLKREKNDIPNRIAELNDEISRLSQALANEQERSAALEKERRSMETKLKEEEERLTHSEKKLLEVKTNKEYQAAQKEIEEHKAQNSLLEEQLLVMMEGVDALKIEIAQKETELSSKSQTIKTEIDVLSGRAGTIEDQITEKESMRATLTKQLGTTPLSTYERLSNKFRNGPVLVKVRKGVCKGCYMNLPPQFFNELLRDRDIKTCPNCARLIYLDEESEINSVDGAIG